MLLSRYTGQDDVLFGATRACRHSSVEGSESIVGPLINTVPMRVMLPPDLPILQCLKNVRADWVAMRAHEHTSLRDIQAWSGFGHDRPLFETILIVENHALGKVPSYLSGGPGHREFQLLEKSESPLVGLAYTESRLLLRLAFGHATLGDDDAARMLGHWRSILMGLVTHADRRVVDLPLLTHADGAMSYAYRNGTPKQSPAPSCLHEMFEAQVARTPGAPALRLEAETIVYDALNARANRLARYLQRLGVGPESRVAVCMARSPAFIAAMLAVLKCGGAYIPIDPGDPKEERISSMLDDSHAFLVLTEGPSI